MILRQDKLIDLIAYREFSGEMQSLAKKVMLFAGPVSILASCFLYYFDSSRPHVWKYALIMTPSLSALFLLMPLALRFVTNAWEMKKGLINFKSVPHGTLREKEILSWSLSKLPDMDSYCSLRVRTHRGSYGIVLNTNDYGVEELEGLFKKNLPRVKRTPDLTI